MGIRLLHISQYVDWFFPCSSNAADLYAPHLIWRTATSAAVPLHLAYKAGGHSEAPSVQEVAELAKVSQVVRWSESHPHVAIFRPRSQRQFAFSTHKSPAR